MTLIMVGRRRGGAAPASPVYDGTASTLTVQRFASGSGTTAISVGVPILTTDSYTSASNVSLWVGGTEVACYVEEQTGRTSDNKPLSLLVQWDQSLTNGSPSTAVLKFTTAPLVSRLTKRTVTWPTISGTIEDATGTSAANIRTAVPTNMQGVAMRPSAEFVKWQGWDHPLAVWGSFTPTSEESAWKALLDSTLVSMYNGTALNTLQGNQYSRVYLESAYAAMTGDIAAFWRAVTIYAWQRTKWYTLGPPDGGYVTGLSDSVGSYTAFTNEQYNACRTGLIAHHLLGDPFGRDTLVLGRARFEIMGLTKSGWLASLNRVGTDGVNTNGQPATARNSAIDLQHLTEVVRVSDPATVYNGKSAMTWLRDLAANYVAHENWKTVSGGRRWWQYLGGIGTPLFGGSSVEAQQTFQAGLIYDALIVAHTHPLCGGALTNAATRLQASLDYIDSKRAIYSPKLVASLPYWDVLVDNDPDGSGNPQVGSPDTAGTIAGLYGWAAATYGGSYSTLANTFLGLLGSTPADGNSGASLNTPASATQQKNTQENFAFSVHALGYRRGSW